MDVTLCPAVFLHLGGLPDLGELSDVIVGSGVMLGAKLDGSSTESA